MIKLKVDNYLWMPKSSMSEARVQSQFTVVTESGDITPAYSETEDYWLLPRNAFSKKAISKSTKFEFDDQRQKAFPKANLTSCLTMDALDPSRTYQREGSAALLKVWDGILTLRCGAGKTFVALHAASQLKVPILVVVNEIGLAQQWISSIKTAYEIDEDLIGRCYGGSFDWEKPITVASVQTLANRVSNGTLPEKMTRHFGVILADEVHVMGAPYFSTAIPPFHGRRWGLSATPKREDPYDFLLASTFGKIVYTYLMPELPVTFAFLQTPVRLNLNNPAVRKETLDRTGELHLGKLWSYFSSHDERMNLVSLEIQKAIDKGRNVLVLSHSRNAVEEIGRRFPDAGVTHGGVKGDQHMVEIQKNPLVAIMKRGKQALDKPDLDLLFLLEPTTKPGVLQQIMGRIQRIVPGRDKKELLVVIFEDVHIKVCKSMCHKIRKLLRQWPESKGGAIPYKTYQLF